MSAFTHIKKCFEIVVTDRNQRFSSLEQRSALTDLEDETLFVILQS